MRSIRRQQQNRTARNVWTPALAIGGIIALLAVFFGLPGYVGYREIEDLRQDKNAYQGYDPTIKGVYLRGSAPTFPQAEHKQPRVNRATCENPYSREDADLCAQWAAVKAVSVGNAVGISALRSTLVSTLVTAVGILMTSLGLVIAAFASRDATRAVRAMENLERGYLNVGVAGVVAGKIRLTLENIGRTPVWVGSVTDRIRGVIHDRDADGLHCVPSGGSYNVDIEPAGGANPGIVTVVIWFNDILDQPRVVEAVLKMSHEVWRLAELREYEDNQERHFPSP